MDFLLQSLNLGQDVCLSEAFTQWWEVVGMVHTGEGAFHLRYPPGVGTLHRRYPPDIGALHRLYPHDVGALHRRYPPDVGALHRWYPSQETWEDVRSTRVPRRTPQT